jgi:hypothetical protein
MCAWYLYSYATKQAILNLFTHQPHYATVPPTAKEQKALRANFRLGCEDLPGTGTLAYL